MKILVFYFIHSEVVVNQVYGLIWMRFSEKIIAGISKYKDEKNILKCRSKLLPNPGVLGYK